MSENDWIHGEVLAFIRENGYRPSQTEIRSRIESAAARRGVTDPSEIDSALQSLADRRLLRPEARYAADIAGARDHRQPNAAPGTELRREIPDVLPEDDDLDGDDEDSQKIADFNRQWDRILDPACADTLPDWIVDAYTSQVREIANRSVRQTWRDIGLYAGVNAGLVGVWWISGAGFPWIVFPLFGWGIGIASQVGATLRRRRHSEEVSLFQRPTPRQLSLLRTLRKVREDFGASATGSIAVMGALVAFNAVTSPFPWSVFPIAALGAGVISKGIGFRSRLTEMKDKLSKEGFRLPARSERRKRRRGISGDTDASDSSLLGHTDAGGNTGTQQPGAAVSKARALAAAIEGDLMRISDNERVREDIYPDVRDCVEQIETLERKRAMISRLLEEVSREQLSKERATLESDMADSDDAALREEYERSIEQLRRQEHSLSRLEREREVMRLRAQSALGALQQMRLELGRLTHLEHSTELRSASNLEARANELSTYIRDVAGAYEQLDDAPAHEASGP